MVQVLNTNDVIRYDIFQKVGCIQNVNTVNPCFMDTCLIRTPISLLICVSCVGGTHITRDTCFRYRGTHITSVMYFPD